MHTEDDWPASDTGRGVAPAIGILLAAAITLILAATLGVFVLGLSDSPSEERPSISLSIDQQGDRLVLTSSSA